VQKCSGQRPYSVCPGRPPGKAPVKDAPKTDLFTAYENKKMPAVDGPHQEAVQLQALSKGLLHITPKTHADIVENTENVIYRIKAIDKKMKRLYYQIVLQSFEAIRTSHYALCSFFASLLIMSQKTVVNNRIH